MMNTFRVNQIKGPLPNYLGGTYPENSHRGGDSRHPFYPEKTRLQSTRFGG